MIFLKKIKVLCFICIILSLTLILSSCEKDIFKKDFSPVKEFTLSMEATKGDKKFAADIICRSYADIKIAFTYPEELSGFTITADENGYNVNAFGVPDILEKDEINDDSLLNVLISGIRAVLFSNHDSFSEEENGYTAALSVDGVPVSFNFSKAGFITAMAAPTINFSAVFKNQG